MVHTWMSQCEEIQRTFESHPDENDDAYDLLTAHIALSRSRDLAINSTLSLGYLWSPSTFWEGSHTPKSILKLTQSQRKS